MISREEFEAELEPVRAALEQRRRRYLRYFYGGAAVAGLLLATGLLCPNSVLLGIEKLLGMHKPITASDIWAFRLFAALCAAMLLLGPVLSYRGQGVLSIERAVYGRLLNLFGAFMPPLQGGGISGADLRRTGLFAAPLLFDPEEGAAGEMNDVRVRLCTAALYTRDGTDDTLVFHGLLILCEPGKRTEELVDEALAASLARPLRDRLALSGIQATALPGMKGRWDERFVYAASTLYGRLQEAAFARMGRNELASEASYRRKYAVPRRLARAGRPDAHAALCDPYAFEFSHEASLTAIAGSGMLLTLGSLFAPALDEARATHFYETMETIDAVTRHLNDSILKA
jgi:hypothetical protein